MVKNLQLMARQRIRLTESQLNRVIKESVKRVLKEFNDPADEERYGYPEDYDPYNPFDAYMDYDTDYDYDNSPIAKKVRNRTITKNEIRNEIRRNCDEFIDVLERFGTPDMMRIAEMEMDWRDNDEEMYGNISRNNRENLAYPGDDNNNPVTAHSGGADAAYNGLRWGKQALPDRMSKSNHINDINLNVYRMPKGRNAMLALSDDENERFYGQSIAPTIRQSFKNGQKRSKNQG